MDSAYLIDGQPQPREAFYAAACDPRRSSVVEACAGSGKTWMLVSRILRALLDGCEPQEILAITFTRKAAGEMRQRLDDWLAEFAAPGCTDAQRIAALRQRGLPESAAQALAPALAGLYERVLMSGRSVEVRTFHAWFSQLLRVAPLELLAELGLQSNMEVLDDLSDHQNAVYRRFHAAVLADVDLRADHQAVLLQRGRSQLRKWLDAAWAKRTEFELADVAGTLEASVAPAADLWPQFAGLQQPVQWLRSDAIRGTVAEVATALGRKTGAVPRKQAVLLEAALCLPDDQAAFDAARAALFTQKGDLRKALGEPHETPGLAALIAMLDLIRDASAQQAAHEEHVRMVRLSRVLLRELAAYKREHGLAEMSDLERGALALLRDATLSGWVQERLDAQVRHVLIDEFQDTSPLQWHALHAWLSAYAGAGGGVSGQRAPSVFIVGDPKQSIYRFRRAEPRVFEAAQAFVVEGLGGQVLKCDHTRRNAPEVLQALNAVFADAQAQAEFAGFRAHTTELGTTPGAGAFTLTRVLRSGPADDRPAPGWRDSLTTPRLEPETVLRQQEADRVAEGVLHLLRQGVAAGDIQVLCRKRESLRLVAQSLAALQLPYAAVEDFALLDSPEVRDLLALLDVLASPGNALSLAQALRSPVFGATDDDLIALAVAARGHGDWWQALADLQESGDASPALQRARSLLQRWQHAADALPPHDLLDRILAEGELIERTAAAVPAPRRQAALGAIDALLAQSLKLDGARYATPYNFVRALKRRAVAVSSPAQRDAVQLLTIHGAKGLEAKVVFVMDSDPQAPATDTATLLIDWPVEAQQPRTCAFLYSEAQCPPSLRPLFDQELIARRREALNSLYVAMTRAKERLIFSATEPHRAAAERSWWQRIDEVAAPWEGGARDPVIGSPVPETDTSSGSFPSPAAFQLLQLPRWRRPDAELAAGHGVDHDDPAAATGAQPLAESTRSTARAIDEDRTALGLAVHRALEWAVAVHPTAAQRGTVAACCEAAAIEHGADVGTVSHVVDTILRSPAAAPYVSAPGWHWAGNEVSVGHGGELLRIDRLVALETPGTADAPASRTWWVLDYKLSRQPQQVAEHRAQLLRYVAAVRALQAGETVRGAFITAQGEVFDVET